jgi:hypothetical protein
MKIFKYMVVGFLALSTFSCGDLEEVNNDPTRLSAVDVNLLLPEVLAQGANNLGYNPYRVAGIFMQQLLGLDAQQLAYNDYIVGEDGMNNYWRTGLYAGVLKSARVLEVQAGEVGNPFYSGVAKIMYASQLGDASCMFGDMPNSEALQGLEFVKPKYDSMEEIFAAVNTMLDAGITDLGSADADYVGGDIILGGDAAAWIKVANAFKARFLMASVKRNPSNAAAAIAAADKAMTSNAENPSFPFETSQTANNPLAAFGQERPNTLGFEPRFAEMLAGDPRLGSYTVIKEEVQLYFDLGNSDLVWAQDNSAMPLITYTEMLFIKAEATAMTGGDASTLLADAVRSSMQLNGVSMEDMAPYIAGLGAATVENIVLEAYKGYYGFNFLQSWNNYRRTGIPNLTPSPNASPSFDPSGIVPQRYLYVDSESQTNSENVEAAKAAQGGGLLDAALWAFKN